MNTDKQFYVYIMTNKSGTLYVGMTSNLIRRVHQHKLKEITGFTKKYNINHLLYFETFRDAYSAIAREKAIKGQVRKKKMELIASLNPSWEDLSQDWYNSKTD